MPGRDLRSASVEYETTHLQSSHALAEERANRTLSGGYAWRGGLIARSLKANPGRHCPCIEAVEQQAEPLAAPILAVPASHCKQKISILLESSYFQTGPPLAWLPARGGCAQGNMPRSTLWRFLCAFAPLRETLLRRNPPSGGRPKITVEIVVAVC